MASATFAPFLFCVSRNVGLEVVALERRVISSVVLEAEDLDTPSNQLYYVLNSIPRFGLLQFKVSFMKHCSFSIQIAFENMFMCLM